MDRPGDIQVLCRLCLVKDQVNIPIFEEQGDIRQIFIKISCCLPVSITKEDNLPKKICDGCSNKLDLLYEFWNTSINAEKTLLTWLGQAGVKDADKTITAVALQIPKAEVEVKVEQPEEIDGGEVEDEEIDGGEVEDFEENDNYEEEEPPPKRARRSAAVKAQMTLANISDDDEDEDIDNDESTTKIEDESDGSEGEVKDPSSFTAIPGTSVDDQPGPSGLGKDGADAPFNISSIKQEPTTQLEEKQIYLKPEPIDIKEEIPGFIDLKQMEHNLSDGLDRVNCQFCEKSFKYQTSLNLHMTAFHSKELTAHVATYTSNNILTAEDMQTNPDKADGTDEKEWFNNNNKDLKVTYHSMKCRYCEEHFKNRNYLSNHIKSRHFHHFIESKCDICSIVLSSKYHLTQHNAAVHPRIEKNAKCTFCHRPFKYPSNLHNHVRLSQCEFCSKNLGCRFHLTRHIAIFHSGSKPKNVDCKFCGRSLKNNAALYRHVVSSHMKGKQK